MTDVIAQFTQVKILVVGDVMLDRYVQGAVRRISPEAPIPVVRLNHAWSAPGGAGNVAACLAGLGCQVTLLGVAGADAAGEELQAALAAAGVAEIELTASPSGRTVVKTRVMADGAQQIVRIDDEDEPAAWAEAAAIVGRHASLRVPEFDAVVLADYEKGTLTPAVVRQVIDAATAAGKPIVVDPKKTDLGVYAGCTVLTPNALEAERAAGRPLSTDAEVESFARDFRERCRLATMLVTRGSQGMTGVDADGAFQIPARVREVADVTGAGDTVVAVLAAGLAARLDVRGAAQLASIAAGIAVSHHGVYVVRPDELRAAAVGAPAKLLSLEQAARVVERLRARGRKIAFTNGCFDLLHPGHLYSLQMARAEGDFLVVGLNSDASVRALKGPTRPIMPEQQRAALLAGLTCVDAVVLFDDETPEKLLNALLPDVLVKGGDYRPEDVVGGEAIRDRGGRVVIVPRLDGLSTSNLVGRMGATPER